jgi:DNA helicase-2/ATP-dependent DNA helicase PcrA
VSFRRIVGVPKRGVGEASLRKFLDWHETTGRSIIEDLVEVDDGSGLPARAKNALNMLGMTLRDIQSRLDHSPADLLEEIIKKTGYADYINDGSLQAEERLENLGVLVAEARAYTSVDSFLEEMSLMSASDETAGDEVTLMTLHAAKGLEFPVVFLVGLEEGLLPHARVFDGGKPDDIEEERRLCYVGITRAREELFVSCANSRTQFGQIGFNAPSRFLSEMGLFAADERESEAHFVKEETEFFSDELDLSPGDRVKTPLFGAGEVLDIDGLAVVVQFDSGSMKKLNVEFARLEKLA